MTDFQGHTYTIIYAPLALRTHTAAVLVSFVGVMEAETTINHNTLHYVFLPYSFCKGCNYASAVELLASLISFRATQKKSCCSLQQFVPYSYVKVELK